MPPDRAPRKRIRAYSAVAAPSRAWIPETVSTLLVARFLCKALTRSAGVAGVARWAPQRRTGVFDAVRCQGGAARKVYADRVREPITHTSNP